METEMQRAFAAGVDQIAAWAELLDAINVFPVADGDTGRNLVASLAPLRRLPDGREATRRRLLLAARGNSGNIAAGFFAGFLAASTPADLFTAAQTGRSQARRAVPNPAPGTMLTVLDALVEALQPAIFDGSPAAAGRVLTRLQETVAATCSQLPQLSRAGVVDAGALGLYLFFERFFPGILTDPLAVPRPETLFRGRLRVDALPAPETQNSHCVDAVIRLTEGGQGDGAGLAQLGDSVVLSRDDDYLKVHLHTEDVNAVRNRLAAMGAIVGWHEDELAAQVRAFGRSQPNGQLCLLSDAAGSLQPDEARSLGITLLPSYLQVGDTSLPETQFPGQALYRAMRRGVKVSTSQASVLERHEHYRRLLSQYRQVVYLCVGSAYTGNFEVARRWKAENDPEDRFTVIDTGAASGRLGLLALATARFAARTPDAASVIAYAQSAGEVCKEFIFLDSLRFLAAGGRMSRTGAAVGDLLRLKPVISPTPAGAKRVGMVRNRDDQLRFALARLADEAPSPLIMLEYADNETWVRGTAAAAIRAACPRAELLLQPLSLTSAAHMGPGTWAMAVISAGSGPA